jgi:hypothetical protein
MPYVLQKQMYFEPSPVGPAGQYVVTTAEHAMPSTCGAGATVYSNVIVSDGWTLIGAGVTSTQAGTITITTYLDQAGTIPIGTVSSQALVASTTAAVSNASAAPVPFQSFKIGVSNSSGSSATLTGFNLLLQSR